MISIRNLTKTFVMPSASSHFRATQNQIPGPIKALDNVSFNLNDGEIVGLLGLNGAGKSTLLRLIYGLLPPTAGEVFVNHINVHQHPHAARQFLGVLPDDSGLYKRLTARENIRYFGELQGLDGSTLEGHINQLISVLGMESIADRRAEGFSLGERMKTALARAIIHQPQHILLDEPTNGLDVITTRAVRQLLQSLKAQGRCVLFSSHLMYEVSGLCDRIIVISNGKVVADGDLNTLLALGRADSLEDAFVNLVSSSDPMQVFPYA